MDQTRRSFLAAASVIGALALRPAGASAQAGEPSTHEASGNANADREPFVVRSADGTVLTAEAKGSPGAPEVLFVQGLRQSRLSWDKQFNDPALAGLRLVRFDLRGHGDSGKPDALEAYSDADRWADDVAAVIAAAKLRRPVLVGWSLGGYVVGAYLRKHGGSGTAGINLVDAVTKLSPDLLTLLAGDFAGTTISRDLGERVAATADFLAACFHQSPPEVDFQRMLVVNGMTPRATYQGFLRTSTTDLEPVLAAYDRPVLLTHGIHDRLVRLAMSERIQALRPGNRLSVFADSGHSPFYEEPRRFGIELADFVVAANKA